jgi:hypothetical protein
MFCAAAAKKNCSLTNFNLRRSQATQTNPMLEFREQGFYLLSLPLGVAEPGVLANSQSCCGKELWW